MAKRVAAAERARYVIYFRGHKPPDTHPRFWVPVFFDPALAKAVLIRFFGNSSYEQDGHTFTLDSGFTAQCEQLDEVWDADHTQVTIPEDMARTVLRFKLGSWEEDHSKSDEVEETTTETGEVVKVKKPKPEKPKRAVKPDNYITIGELCEQWGIKPLHARTALRASDLVKPDYGWSFDPKDVPKIKKICGVK